MCYYDGDGFGAPDRQLGEAILNSHSRLRVLRLRWHIRYHQPSVYMALTPSHAPVWLHRGIFLCVYLALGTRE